MRVLVSFFCKASRSLALAVRSLTPSYEEKLSSKKARENVATTLAPRWANVLRRLPKYRQSITKDNWAASFRVHHHTHASGIGICRVQGIRLANDRICGGSRDANSHQLRFGRQFRNLMPRHPFVHTLPPNEGLSQNLAGSVPCFQIIKIGY